MGINLMALLQSAGALPTPESPEINVVGKKKIPATPMASLIASMDEDAPVEAPLKTGNHAYIQQGLQSQESSAPGVRKGDLQHHGRFGVKGTLRDILGALGDNYLIQNNQKPQYSALRQDEKIADAMAGFTQGDPRAAIERIAALPGGAEMAQKMYDNTVQNQVRQQTAQSLEATRKQTASAAKATQLDKFTTRFGQMLNGADTPEKRAATLRLAGKQAAATGISLEELGIGEGDLTPEDQAAFVSGATTVNQQNNLPLAQKRIGIAQQNADSASQNAKSQRINANRPRSAPNAPQPTAVSEAAPLLKLVEEGKTLTPGQEAKLTRLGMSPQRGMSESEKRRAARAARNGSKPSDGGTGKYVIRDGKMVPK